MMYRVTAVALLILFTVAVTGSPQARPASTASPARIEAMRAIDESSAKLTELQGIYTKMVQSNEQMSKLYSMLGKKIAEAGKIAADPGHTHDQLMQAVKQLDATQTSTNLQYLQLQQAMQNESRQFELLTNIMKTKHDTVKNAISNIR